jgi:hypothetical protein
VILKAYCLQQFELKVEPMGEMLRNEKWYKVSLRLMGDNLPVETLEEDLKLSPSYVGKRGEHINGNPKYAKNQTNVWVWNYPANSDVEFEEQIEGLLNILEPKIGALKEILAMPEVEGELFLGFSSDNGQGGAFFSPVLLRRIADCGLSVLLDLYPSMEKEQVLDN